MCVSPSCTHCRASYWPFSLVIRPSNSSVEPEAAVASVMAGMGSDSAQGRQRRLTGMLPGWTKGLIVIHEFVSAAAPGLGAAAGRDGQGDTKWERWTIQLILTLLMGCCSGEYEHLHMFFCGDDIPANSHPHFNPRWEIVRSGFAFWITQWIHFPSLTWPFSITRTNTMVLLKETFAWLPPKLAKTTSANDHSQLNYEADTFQDVKQDVSTTKE